MAKPALKVKKPALKVKKPALNVKSKRSLAVSAKEVLFEWLEENSNSPYPSEEVKLQLVRQTGLTLSQVSNWFINARRRYVKALQEKEAHNAEDALKENRTANTKETKSSYMTQFNDKDNTDHDMDENSKSYSNQQPCKLGTNRNQNNSRLADSLPIGYEKEIIRRVDMAFEKISRQRNIESDEIYIGSKRMNFIEFRQQYNNLFVLVFSAMYAQEVAQQRLSGTKSL